MSQGEILNLIDKMKFTTHHELCESTNNVGENGITKALTKLKNHNDIVCFKISRHTIYLSNDFYNQIGK